MKPKKTTKPTKANPLKQNLLIRLGLVSMTNTKVGEMAKSLARGRQHSAEEGDKLAAQILRQASETKKHLEKRVAPASLRYAPHCLRARRLHAKLTPKT